MQHLYESLPAAPAELEAEYDELVEWLHSQQVTVYERPEDGWTEYSEFVERDNFDRDNPDNENFLDQIEADTDGHWGVMIDNDEYAPLADSLIIVGRFKDDDEHEVKDETMDDAVEVALQTVAVDSPERAHIPEKDIIRRAHLTNAAGKLIEILVVEGGKDA